MTSAEQIKYRLNVLTREVEALSEDLAREQEQGQARVEWVPVQLEWWPIARFADIVGWTRRKVESKIDRELWTENVHYRYDPDGEIHINITGYNEWVQSGQGSKRGKNQSKSGSVGKVSAFGKPSNGCRHQPTRSGPGSSEKELKL